MSLNNLEKTKNSLKIAFSVIVFITIILMWTIYFSTKYIHEISREEFEFNKFIELIKTDNNFVDNIWFWHKLEFINWWQQHHTNRWNFWIKMIKAWKWTFNWFVNHILIDKEANLISSNIREEIPEKIILNSINDDKYYSLIQESSFLIKKVKLENWKTFIAYKKLPYSFLNYLKDLFWFVIIALLFTALVYLIWRIFVNRVFIPVEENMKDMNDFIHNAWHELKTPISVIDSNIQLMLDLKKYDEKMLFEQKREILKLNSLIDSLVELSNFWAFEDTLSLNLKEWVDEVLNDFKFKIEEKQISINQKLKNDIFINANKEYLYIFLSNLIWNAIKYNKVWWKINIIYENWKLIIEDNWIWIKEEELEKIFDRFYKSDESRNTDGFGIWLSLVKKVADLYKWKIYVETIKGKQTKFIIIF